MHKYTSFTKKGTEAKSKFIFTFSILYPRFKLKQYGYKYNLPFVLLSDPELEAIGAYGVWQEKKLYGKVSFGVVRTTFIIDENGIIEKVMPKVKPDTNAAEILEFL